MTGITVAAHSLSPADRIETDFEGSFGGEDVRVTALLLREVPLTVVRGSGERPHNAKAYCRGCGRGWTGVHECHCPGCHQHFSSCQAFDRHRVSAR
jgi:hypothetical protein